jgi:hypothetical protein
MTEERKQDRPDCGEPEDNLRPFYVTYGFGTTLEGCYSRVWAANCGEARKEVMEKTSGRFAFMYGVEDFDRAIGKFGLVLVPLQEPGRKL